MNDCMAEFLIFSLVLDCMFLVSWHAMSVFSLVPSMPVRVSECLSVACSFFFLLMAPIFVLFLLVKRS